VASILIGLTPTQVANLSLAVIATLDPVIDIPVMTTAQAAALTASQLIALTTPALQAFSAAQTAVLSATALSGIGADITLLTTTEIAALTAYQLARLATTQIPLLTQKQIAALSPLQIAALTGAQIPVLTTQQLAWLSGSQFSALTTGQISALTGPQYAAITFTQVRAMTNAQIGALRYTLIANLSPAAIAGITALQAPSLTTSDFYQFSAAQMQAFDPSVIAVLSTAQVATLTIAQFTSLSTKQIAAFSATQIGALNNTLVRNLTVANVSLLTSSQINGLTASQMSWLSSAIVTSILPILNATEVGFLSAAQVSSLTGTQIAALTVPQVAGLTSAQIGAISKAALPSLSTAQISALSATQVAGLTATQIGPLSSAQIAAISASAISGLSTAAIAALSTADCQSLTAAQIGGLTASQIGAFSLANFDAFLSNNLTLISASAVSGITTADLQSLTAAQAQTFTDKQLASMTSAQLDVIATVEATNYVVDGALTYTSALQLLLNTAVGGMTQAKFIYLQSVAADIDSGVIQTSEYVRQIFDKVVEGNSANATWRGGSSTATALGNLSATSTETQVNELIGKWFLGTDLPSTAGSRATGYAAVNLPLFSAGGPVITDINQGSVGDCYLLAALGETALQDPSYIQNMIQENPNGTYSVKFTINGVSDYVTVNNQLPIYNSVGNYVYDYGGSSGRANDWSALIEKAYVQYEAQTETYSGSNGLHSNAYADIGGGWDEALWAITGKNDDSYSLWVTNTSDYLASVLSNIQTAFYSGEEVIMATGNADTANNIVASHMYIVTGVNAAAGTVSLDNPWNGSGVVNGMQMQFTANIATLAKDGVTFLATNESSMFAA
jgi:hypothetical protein